MPPAALTNDMMIFYAPKELYTMKVTVMEMICASVCLTSMICFTLEARHRKENPFDSEVHMARHRMGARGNATSFPLPWQDILSEIRRHEDDGAGGEAPDLPWTGSQLSNFVSVLLKTSEEDNPKSMASFIHQAHVRRDVVIKLIEDAKARGHRAYVNVDISRMRDKAKHLPENGVPPEIIKLLPHDSDLDKIQVQKAATPVPGRADLEGMAATFRETRPNAVVLERSGEDEGDINAQRIRAIKSFVDRLEPPFRQADGPQQQPPTSKKRRRAANVDLTAGVGEAEQGLPGDSGGQTAPELQRVAVVTGSAMVDQFEPWYFGVAFAFLFKFCTGMPDMPKFTEKERYRRAEDAPRVEPPLWVRVMARRVEAQVSRDWHFGFVTWNYIFRSAVNLSRTLYSYETTKTESGLKMTALDLQNGAIEICRALFLKYTDLGGKEQSVKGDMTKVRYVAGLSSAAMRLLQNIEHTSRKLPGTQETRRIMRFDTNASRVRFGVPIFVTFTPDEAHSMIMVRLSRNRRNDPVHYQDPVGEKCAGRETPSIETTVAEDDVEMEIPIADLMAFLPSHDERKQILARDPLACVDGFHVIVQVTYEYLFGMRICSCCPDCNNADSTNQRPCQDHFGSNATAEGGI